MEILYNFADELNNRGHLTSILKGVKLYVQLNWENGSHFITIENGKVEVLEQIEGEIGAIISGEKGVLEDILIGKLKLRNASRNNEIELKSTFRTSLFLESLFYLARQDELIEKVEISK